MYRALRWAIMNQRYMSVVVISLLAACAVARGDGLVQFPDGKASVVVPVERAGHSLVVKAKIDGQDAGWFVIDTGGQMTTVSSKTARALNLPDDGQAII